MIAYRLLPDGGFVCGCRESMRTAYSYPTSTNAALAKNSPAKIAESRMKLENKLGAWRDAEEYLRQDMRHWELIDSVK